MLSLSFKKYIIILAIPLLLLSNCLAAEVALQKEGNNANLQQSFSNLFESASKENKHLIDGWNNYIIKVLGYSNAEHLKVIEELTIDYAKAVNELDEKYEKNLKQDKIQYTSKWIDQLAAKFGSEFVCNNQKDIMLNLMMAFDRDDAKKYDQDAKEIISKELILYLAYEKYLDLFMDYYEQLSVKDQKRMKAWKKVAEKYLSITKRSHFAFVYYGSNFKYKILDNVMQRDNKELYMYFNKSILPFGSGALRKAREDLRMYITKQKIQNTK
jgi:hypothetical protein